MSKNDTKDASWTGFFGGCLVLVLIFGGLFATFRYFQQKDQARVQALETDILQPYWSAVRAGDYPKAHSLRSADWQSGHSAEELAAAYDRLQQEHGEIQEAYIHVANEYFEPGQKDDACRAECYYAFKDGFRGKVIFDLRRQSESSPWKIGSSSTTVGANSLGDGVF